MTKRVAIYARYSSDLQSDASIDDQVRICKQRVQSESWGLVDVYSDAAISGSTTLRPGYQRLLKDASKGLFDIVVTEALDRLSRDQEDIAALYKHLSFSDVRLFTLAEGEVSELHIGLKGTMNALFLKDLAAKIRRGQRGNIASGRSAGGLSYGYDVAPELDGNGNLVRGQRKINEVEAVIIQRIYNEYAAGKSPRAIATGLNRNRIPSPKGGLWSASTINGNRARRNGVLYNEAYVGLLVYNRTSMRRNPTTGRRVHKINPSDEWVVQDAPELRIVSDDLWDKVQAIKKSMGPHPTHKRRRPKRLLSGLVHCGTCGGKYTVIGEERFGCSRHRETGACTNNRTISVPKLENKILNGLKERLLSQDMVTDFVEQVRIELKTKAKDQHSRTGSLNNEKTDIIRKIKKLVTVIEDGLFTPEMKERMKALDKRRTEIEDELCSAPASPVVELIPNIHEVYRQKVENLRSTLDADDVTRSEAIPLLHSLVDQIIIHKRPGRGQVAIELYGSLAKLISLAGGNADEDDVMTMMVAEEGLEPPTRGL
jgi:site-specific DNA recombinase